MKITLVTIVTPYRENYKGTTAVQYHLLAHRPKDVEVEIYSFNNNGLPEDKIKEVERELNVKIHLLPLPTWYKLVFALHLLFIRLFLKYPLHHYIAVPKKWVDKIKAVKPNGIWIYGEELSKVTRQFEGYKRIHTLPDSEALYYHRMLGTRFVMNDMKKYWRCAFMYPKFRHMERDFDRDKSIHYHLVGKADAEFLRDMAPGIQAHFIRHPHYDVAPLSGLRHFHSPIRLLIAGQYNLYMKQDADEFVSELLGVDNKTKEGLQNNYQITFLGHGWEQHASDLQKDGWNAQHITFAPNYIEEVTKHDIQLAPISIGTGTKGKVLDALANGLLVIGTPYAMENIAVESGKTCIVYHSTKEAVAAMQDIANNVEKYEAIAEEGRKAVLKYHSRMLVSSQLFDLFR